MKHRNMIFVFGSNKSGIHATGSAKTALRMGAQWGIGEGLTGRCYALPTKGLNITFMTLDEVQVSVQNFIRFAYDNPGAHFMVTQVGCGLSGFTPKQIAPYFQDAPDNCYFDEKWRKFLKDEKKYWGSYG